MKLLSQDKNTYQICNAFEVMMAVRILSRLQTTCLSSAWHVTPSHGGSLSTRGHPTGKYILAKEEEEEVQSVVQLVFRRFSAVVAGLASFIWTILESEVSPDGFNDRIVSRLTSLQVTLTSLTFADQAIT